MSEQNNTGRRQRRFTSTNNSGGGSKGGFTPAANAVLKFDNLTADGGDASSLKFERDASGKVKAIYGTATLMNDAFDGAVEKGTEVKVKLKDARIGAVMGYLEKAEKSVGEGAIMLAEGSYLNNGEVTFSFLKGLCVPEDVNGVLTERVLTDRLVYATEIKRTKRDGENKPMKDSEGRYIKETIGAKVDVAIPEDACDMFSAEVPDAVKTLMSQLNADREAGKELDPFEERWLTDLAENWENLPPFFRMEALWDANMMTRRYENEASSFGFALRKFSQFDLEGNEVAPGEPGSLITGRIFGGSTKSEDGEYLQVTFAEAIERSVAWGVPSDKTAPSYEEMVELGIMGALDKHGLITTGEDGNPQLLTKMNPVILEDLDFYMQPESLTEEKGVAFETMTVTTTNFGGKSVQAFAKDSGEAPYNPLKAPVIKDGEERRYNQAMFVKSSVVLHHPGRTPNEEQFFATKAFGNKVNVFKDKNTHEVTAYPTADAYTIQTIPTAVSAAAGFEEYFATVRQKDLDSVNDYKIKNGGAPKQESEEPEASGPAPAPGM
ncbi:hypothetical protein [Sulfitobacter sp. R18_1]|uniref:hypothetical protein n=1 Tax=Sulfitobacter sp. R18_1 TaxID=2821104 RepID=UPI001ADBB699|nr:hypothetical protein [Sulfitobacter sp. R18_1]MBO9428531.1 hypothetical protein [Sulfitobacter sp. R18_1]